MNNSRIIYIVFGSIGDYEDYREWDVLAFSSFSKAEQYKEELLKIDENTITRIERFQAANTNIGKLSISIKELKNDLDKARSDFPITWNNFKDLRYNIREVLFIDEKDE